MNCIDDTVVAALFYAVFSVDCVLRCLCFA